MTKFHWPIFIPFMVFLAFLSGEMALAQSRLDFRSADSLTYQLYQQAHWRPLRKAGKEVLSSGIDYQYLRARLGYANFATGNYIGAEKHFSRALGFNAYDEFSQAMLYYSLKATLKHTEAGSVYRSLSPSLQQKVAPGKSFKLFEAHADYGTVLRSKADGLNAAILAGSDSLYGEEQIYGNGNILDAGLKLQLMPGLLFYAGGQSISIPLRNHFVVTDYAFATDSIVRDTIYHYNSYYYSLQSRQHDTVFHHRLSQQSVYVQAIFSPSAKIRFTLGMHMLQVKQTNTYSQQETVTWSDTAWVNTETAELSLVEAPLTQMRFADSVRTLNDYSLMANVRINAGVFSPEFGYAYSKLNYSKKIQQLQAGLFIMPMGNLNLYSHSVFAFMITQSKQSTVFKQTIGFNIARPLWFEASVLTGKLNLFADQNGYIIYNMPDEVSLKLESVLTCLIGKNLQLSLRVQHTQAKRPYFWYNNTESALNKSQYSIQSQTIIGGVKWIF
ncbi:MAG: hypothetical protein KKD74_03365 [Bacteroidetes bacterium]|nr:hypothetical protein [Bacteroidota bacterium]